MGQRRRRGRSIRSRTSSPHSNRSTTALRALRVLEVLAQARAPVSVADVARILDVGRSRAYRMLVTLIDAGYVVRDPRTRGYRLSYKILTLSRPLLTSDEREEMIADALHDIASKTGESAHFSVFDRDGAVLVQRVKGVQLVTIDFQIGDRVPLHCTSIGKVLLAYQDPGVTDAVIRRGLPRMARNTITSARRLRAELRKVRAQGYAYDDLEFADDMRCVAVPVLDKDGALLGGISLSGPASRFTPSRLRDLRDAALDAARRLSSKFSGATERPPS